MIELSYDIDADENGMFDGRKLARQLIGDAFRLLVPYVHSCPGCTDALFTVIANDIMGELHEQSRESGQLQGFMFCTEEDPAKRAEIEKVHLAAASAETARLLKQAAEQTHSHDWNPPASLSDLDDEIPF
jgi:hypothetical protein